MQDRSRVERADAAALWLVAAIFLTYTISGAAWYFSDGHLPPWLLIAVSVYAPWALAAAVDVLGFLVGRRVHGALHAFQQAPAGTPERLRARRSLTVNAAILAALVAFSVYNGLGFLWASGWRAPGGPLALPGTWPYVLRALAGPLGFVAATLLTPVQQSLSGHIRSEVHAVAFYAFGIVRRQWRKRLDALDREGHDLTPLLIALSDDDQERAILSTLYRGMHPEIGPVVPHLAPALPAIAITAPSRPPTGPGSPALAGDASKRARPGARPSQPDAAIALIEPPEWRRGKRPRTASAERRVRRVLEANAGISTRALAKAARVSDSTASKYRRLWGQEQLHGSQLAQ